jgi:uncharacterized protein (TIGR02466 family)
MKTYNYKYYFWGPYFFHIKIDPKDIKLLKKLCHRKKERLTRHTLAGDIKDEYGLEHRKVQTILQEYLKVYQEGYCQWYNSKIKPEIKTKSAWVNYMKAGDYNPVHVHQDCDLSSVIYLDIPDLLKKEIKQYEGTTKGPGCISFYYGEIAPYTISNLEFTPEIGDMFIFPYSLRHCVNPYKSKCERVSVAVNYVITNRELFSK